MKLLGLLLPLSICFTVCLNSGPKDKRSAPELITGGTVAFDFANPEDVSRFDFYTSYETNPSFYDGVMYSYLYAEQKIILRDLPLNEYLLEADFGPSVYKGHIDMGFYIQASNPGNDLDQINAWEVNIKHDDNAANWNLRLYRFDDGHWGGTHEEVSNMPFWDDEWIHLSVLVKDGYVTAYINHQYDNPMFTHSIGTASGLLGIRSFRCPAKMTNLSITSPSFTIDTSKLSNLINECNALHEEDFTPSSWSVLSAALVEANAVLSSPINQLIVNDATIKLQKAKNELLARKTYAELQTLIHECEQITDAENYTKNSWQSFIFCLNRAKELTPSSSIEDVSYNYAILLDRKNNLIRYGG